MRQHLFDGGDLVVPGQAAPIVLRDYQVQAKAAVLGAKDRGLQRIMLVLPTGCGKTTVFAALIEEFDRTYDTPSLVVAHRQELLDQARDRIEMMAPHLSVGVEGGGREANGNCRVVVAGVASIGRTNTNRLGWFHPGFLIMDEGHHAAADTWQNVMRRFGSYSGTCFTLAVTATDHRMDNRPLHGSDEAIFEDVVFRYPLRDAVRDGWLVDLRGFRVATGLDLAGVKTQLGDYNQSQLARAVNTEARNHLAVQHWSEIASDRQTIVFCVDIEHANSVAEMFCSQGVRAESVDGTMKQDHREGVMRRFRNGQTQVLVNVEVATEGFDAPTASCVLMLRPTQSWALYTQMAGRGVRTLPGVVDGLSTATERRAAILASGKPDCYVIDVVDVSKEFSLNAPPVDEDGNEKKKPTPASAAGLIGLPADFDLQGHSLFEAAEWAEELSPVKRAEMFRRPMSFDDLSTVLSEVDLLRELSIPEEVQGISRLAWMKTGEAEYTLACGSSNDEPNRIAILKSDELGRFRLRCRSDLMDYGEFPVSDDLQQAFDGADRLIHMTFPDCGPIVTANAKWREEPATERQFDALRRMGADEATLQLVSTRGQARALIEQFKLGKKVPRRKGR